MDGSQLLDALDFDDDHVLDEKVDAITTVEYLASINDREHLLALHRQASLQELEHETGLVRRFQHPRTQLSMHGDCGAVDAFRQRIQ